jgi:hypothetical protein
MNTNLKPITACTHPPAPPPIMWTKLWLQFALSAGVTVMWLALALVSAARADWVVMGVNMVGVLSGVAAISWSTHMVLQLAERHDMARFAYEIAEQKFGMLVHDLAAEVASNEGRRLH